MNCLVGMGSEIPHLRLWSHEVFYFHVFDMLEFGRAASGGALAPKQPPPLDVSRAPYGRHGFPSNFTVFSIFLDLGLVRLALDSMGRTSRSSPRTRFHL